MTSRYIRARAPAELAPPRAPAARRDRAAADQVSQRTATRGRRAARRLRHAPHSVVADHPTRGIGAALRWTEAEFRRYSRACGGCLQRSRSRRTPSPAARVPTPTLVDERRRHPARHEPIPNRVVIITGHIDSRVTDPMNATADAPGANDDGSGTAAVIEAARVLSRHRFPATIVYAAAVGRGAGAARRQDPRRLRQGAGLAGRCQSQQRHHRQQLRLRRRVRRRPCPRLLRRAALAGRRGAAAAGCAASAARTIRPRATCRATSTVLPTISASASTSARSGATTASAAAATIPSS